MEFKETKTEKVNSLVLILDVNASLWGKRKLESSETKKITFNEMLNHILIFVNTYLMTKHHNRISIIASTNKNR